MICGAFIIFVHKLNRYVSLSHMHLLLAASSVWSGPEVADAL